MEKSKFDGFRVEVDERNRRADIVLSRPPLNVVLFSQRKVMANQFYELDRNENIRVIVLRADGDNFSSGGNIAGFLEETPEDLSMLAQNVLTPEKIKKPVIPKYFLIIFFVIFCRKCNRYKIPYITLQIIIINLYR